MLYLPATALAVRRMIAFYGIETEGKIAVIVGRNDITAKPFITCSAGACATLPPYETVAVEEASWRRCNRCCVRRRARSGRCASAIFFFERTQRNREEE